MTDQPSPQYDAIVIGAGMSGMYQLLKLRELGLKVRVLEAGTGVGGTWYWNRYPGARFDSESYSYAFSFSKDLLDEWDWSEHFAGQPETLRYLNPVPQPGEIGALAGRDPHLGYYPGGRQHVHLPLHDHRRRAAVGAHHAEHSGCGQLQGPVLPYRALAA